MGGVRVRFLFLFSLLFLSYGIEGTERKPWLGNLLEFEWQNDWIRRTYSKVEIGHHRRERKADDLFYSTELRSSLFEYGAEIEAIAAWTRKQRGSVDALKATGRYLFTDDIAGDPLSILGGLTLTKAFKKSLRDISSFHHGLYEADFFISFGKEKSFRTYWVNRWWVIAGVGFAERGSSWIYIQADYAFRFKVEHGFRLFVEGLLGFGNRRLKIHSFKGYGLVKHRSCDLGIEYTYFTDVDGFGQLSYRYRPYAHNFPCHAHLFTLSYTYPFGL